MNYYKEGDRLLILNKEDDTKHIVQVNDVDKSENTESTYEFKCLYGSYATFDINWINNDEIEIIKKVTDKDINLFCEENEINKRIGDYVIYENQKQTITCYDLFDDEYLLSSGDWVKDYHFEDKIDLSYFIGDIVLINDSGDKHIVKIIDTDEVSDFPYKVECLYGEHSAFDNEWIKESDITESLDCSEINDLLEEMEIAHAIGETVFYDDEQVEVLCFDTYDGCYYVKNKSNGHERWADKDEVVAHLFSEGDLVKIKKFPDCIVRIGCLCDDGDIEVECVVGDYGNIDDYYKHTDLETATQAEVDILQKDFLFKVGEKVLYGEDRTEDYIHNIDTSKSTDLPYYLGESWDYVSEKEIFKIVKEVEEVLVSKVITDEKTGNPNIIFEILLPFNSPFSC